MATLREYFAKDGSKEMTVHATWELRNEDGSKIAEVIARVHLALEANAKYLSFFIPQCSGVELPEALVLNKWEDCLKIADGVEVTAGFVGAEEVLANSTLHYTGRIIVYSDRRVPQEMKQRMHEEGRKLGHTLVFRDAQYMDARNRVEKPIAFICHDSRDKETIAQPLAVELQKLMCPVWYDEFSLKVGDSLREGIERGIRECKKCILLLTPNFLRNSGWTKREYDSIFTRELVEERKVILPVWSDVGARDVYEYSPILADRLAVKWSLGVERVARELNGVLQAP